MPGSRQAPDLYAIIDRIREWAGEHPEATEYAVHDEAEARDILLVVADQAAVQLPAIRDRNTRAAHRRIVQQYRRAVYDGRAFEFLRDMTEADQLQLFGLKIVVPAIFVQ